MRARWTARGLRRGPVLTSWQDTHPDLRRPRPDSPQKPRHARAGEPPERSYRPRERQMSAAQETRNMATFKRFHDAVNTGDLELISTTMDEIVEPDALIHTPLPIEATGA